MNDVVAGTTLQCVSGTVAHQAIGAMATSDVFNRHQGVVALARGDTTAQIHHKRPRRRAVVNRIAASSAVEQIIAAATGEPVVAKTAQQCVVGTVADQQICADTTCDVFNRDQSVVALARGAASIQINLNGTPRL